MATGGGSGQTQVTRSEPWSGQIPYLEEIFARAQSLGAVPTAAYPGATLAPPSAETEAALAATAGRAQAGSPLAESGRRALQASLDGRYLGANPALAQALAQATAALRPGIDGAFAGAGRYGSGAHARALAEAAAEAGTRLAYEDYGRERQLQAQAALAAPQYAAADYADLDRLAQAGAARDALAQQALDEARARWESREAEPWERLQRYAGLVQGQWGGTTTRTIAARPSAFGAGLGGALGGAQLGSMILPGWGTGIGGAIGALGGLLGR